MIVGKFVGFEVGFFIVVFWMFVFIVIFVFFWFVDSIG